MAIYKEEIMKTKILHIITITLILFFTLGCSGGGGDSSSGDSSSGDSSSGGVSTDDGGTTNPPPATQSKALSGTIIDGLIKDAQVCLDVNANKQCDADEPTTTTTTEGTFTLNVDATLSGTYKVLSVGGIDTATNQFFDGVLEEVVEVSPNTTAIQTQVTPLTTIASKIYDTQKAQDDTFTPTQAKEKLATSLGLTTAQISANPLEDKALFAKTQKIVQATKLLAVSIQKDTTDRDANQDAFNSVLSQIASTLNENTTNEDLNISKVVVKLKESDATINISTDLEVFVQDYANTVETKINQTQNVEDLTSVQNGLESFVAEITTIIQDSTTLNDDLDNTLANLEQISTTTIVQTAQSAKALLTRQVVIPRGDTSDTFVTTECGTKGGIAVYSGIDANNDGTLSEAEQNDTPQVVCNGADGENGFTSLISTTTPSLTDCPEGGVTINFGVDLNVDAVLDSNEITQSINLCNGVDGTNGLDGATGAAGTAGTDGQDGTNGVDGVNGVDGASGTSGEAVFSELGTLKGTVPLTDFANATNATNTRNLRQLTSMSGGLWLTPSKIEAAIAEDKKAKATSASKSVPEPILKPIPVAVDINTGAYEVKNLPSNSDYALMYINSAQKSKKVESITITPGSITASDITTEQLQDPGSVTLTVQNLNGTPLVGAVVRLNELDKNVTTITNDAVATFNTLPVGTYSVTISHPDYIAQYKTFNVETNATTNLGTIQLNNIKGKLAGRVSASDVDDYSNIIVYAQSTDGSVYTTLTNSSGNYLFNALPIGSGYSVVAYAHDYQSDKVDGINIIQEYVTTANTINLIKYPTAYIITDSNGTISVGSITGYARFADVTDGFNHAGIIVSLEETGDITATARDG